MGGTWLPAAMLAGLGGMVCVALIPQRSLAEPVVGTSVGAPGCEKESDGILWATPEGLTVRVQQDDGSLRPVRLPQYLLQLQQDRSPCTPPLVAALVRRR